MVSLYYFDKQAMRNEIILACTNLAKSRGTTAPSFSIYCFLGSKQLCTRFLYNFYRYKLWATSYTRSSTRSLNLIKIFKRLKIHITQDLAHAQNRLILTLPSLFSAQIHLVCICILSFIKPLNRRSPYSIRLCVNLRTRNPPYSSLLSSLPKNTLVIIVIQGTLSE